MPPFQSSYPPTPLSIYAHCSPETAKDELLPVLDEMVLQMAEADSDVGRTGLIQRRVRMFEPREWRLIEGHVQLPSFSVDVRRVESFEQIFDIDLDPRHPMTRAELHKLLKKEVDKLFRPIH